VEEIKCYKSLDGIIHKTIEDAIQADAIFEFKKWYSDNLLYGNYEGSKCNVEELIAWLKFNKTEVLKFIRDVL
jgi:hypothetical protein